ncbi:MAG: uncharacterized protein PWQ11_26 [Candidatus Diapherotrites archaeon]|nr:uncharacterized protein [Candidatus Diapherotrites archaeon]
MRTVIYRKDLKARYLLTGLPGIGRVGHVAAAYMLNKMDSTLVADIYSEYFPQQVVIEQGGILRLLRNQLYYVDAKEPFFILTGDVQPVGSSPAEFYEYTSEILELVKGFGVEEIYTMAGIDRGPQRMLSEPGVVVAGTDEEILKRFKELGAKIDDSGAITGAAGLLLGVGALEGFKGACLMGETSAQLTVHGDPGAALAVTRMIMAYLGNEIDLADLEKAASGFEELLRKMAAPPKEETKPPEPTDYIR